VNGSVDSVGSRTTYSVPGLASAYSVELSSPRGSMSSRPIRSASRRVSPIASRAGSSDSYEGNPDRRVELAEDVDDPQVVEERVVSAQE